LAWHSRTGEDCAADQLRGQFSARKFLKREVGSAATTTTIPPGGGGAELPIGENESHETLLRERVRFNYYLKEKGRVSVKLMRGRMEFVESF
jgi:hypothetical protein